MELTTFWMTMIPWICTIWGVYTLYQGYRKGAIVQLSGVLAIFLSGLVFINWLEPAFNRYLLTIGFYKTMGLVIISFVIMVLIVKWLIKKLFGFWKLKLVAIIDHLLGLLLSGIKFWLKMALVVMLLMSPLFKNGDEVVQNSWLHQVSDVIVNLDFFKQVNQYWEVYRIVENNYLEREVLEHE